MRRSLLLSALAVAAAAFAVHGRTLGAGFVYDDHRFVEQNAAIRSVDPVAFFTDASTASASSGIEPDVYRPLRTLDFSLDHLLFGLEPWGWHLHSLLWHALAAALVLRVLWGVFPGAPVAAALGALLFAVHPVTSESVAWVSSRGDLMAVALMAAALVVLERAGAARTALGALGAALACFAKESAVVLPALLLLRDLALPATTAPPRRVTWARTALLALVVGGYFAVRLAVLPGLAQVDAFPGGSRAATARAMLAGLSWYGEALVAPSGFPFDAFLPVPLTWAEPAVVVGAGLLATLLAAGLLGARRGPRALALATWGALACLVPVSNVLVPLKAFVAERFLYPSLAVGVAGVALAVASGRGRARLVPGGLALVAALLLVPVTWGRDAAWHDEESLWEAVRRDRPDNPSAYEGLAYAAFQRGHADLAERAYRSYLEHNPDDGKSWMLLGHNFGRVAQALYVVNLEPGATTDVAQRRAEALRAQLSAYRAALAAWARVGLARGRGSEALVRETQLRRLDAAWLLPDVREARDANEALLRLDGFDGAAPDVVLRDAPYPRRRARLALALHVALTPIASLPSGAYEVALGIREAVLKDVGIDPGLPRGAVLAALEDRFAAMAAEPGDRVEASVNLAEILRERGDRERARRVLEEAVARHPGRPDLRARLEALLRGPP